MNPLMKRLSPRATDMIRADHTRVLAAFHQYDARSRAGTRQALVESICLALEIHARIEEEIFYPAMRAAGAAVVEELIPGQNEMRGDITALRAMDPRSAEYDSAFMELMRDVMHHVADEETILLPEAESVLGAQLGELGARMSRRRLQLSAPHAGAMARNKARAMPGKMLVMAGALLAGAYVFRRAFTR